MIPPFILAASLLLPQGLLVQHVSRFPEDREMAEPAEHQMRVILATAVAQVPSSTSSTSSPSTSCSSMSSSSSSPPPGHGGGAGAGEEGGGGAAHPHPGALARTRFGDESFSNKCDFEKIFLFLGLRGLKTNQSDFI